MNAINVIKKAIRAKYSYLKLWMNIFQVKRMQSKALIKLQDKQPITCVFLALESSVWKYDRIYQIMSNNDRFNPIIVVCPVVNYGKDQMLRKMDMCYARFVDSGYNVIKSYNIENDSYLDLRSLNPDILFYTNPYDSLIDKRYFITNFLDILTVYVSYCINCSKDDYFSSDLPLHNLVWRRYAETEYALNISKKIQKRRAENVVYSGYPGIEVFIDKDYSPHTNPWKLANPKLKRIIWAPHHTIKRSDYGHTCFLEYSDFFLEMARKYEDRVQFVFKPHPILRSKLELLWGKEKTDSYYEQWRDLPNTTIHESDYTDLFLTSDAMIHDSGSFTVEYLYVNKPVMRTVSDMPLPELFNQFGLDCTDQYYLAYSKDDIEKFINQVINGKDPMREQRTKFVNDVLLPKGSPSQNVIDDIIDSIDNQILYRN